MGVTAGLLLEAHFSTPQAARRVARYLPSEGRVALAADVPAVDRPAYRIIEGIEFASVETLKSSALRCAFDFSRARDFDEYAIGLFDTFRALGADVLVGALVADEEKTVYVALEGGETAVLVPDGPGRMLFDDADAEELIALAQRILRKAPARTSRELRYGSRAPKKPTLVLLTESPRERR